MAQSESRPMHLDASELGTKEYWDNYYQNELGHHDEEDESYEDDDDDTTAPIDPSELDSWFDDVGAPTKTLAFLTSENFPLSPNFNGRKVVPSVLDLGTGNGSALFSLWLDGGYQGQMVGVDYSPQSIRLAKRFSKRYSESRSSSAKVKSHHDGESADTRVIKFAEADLIKDEPRKSSWWPRGSAGFDPDPRQRNV